MSNIPAPTLEIVTSRVFDAPRAAVYAAFADPTRVVQWWGPAGFTSTIQEFDLRPGGAWRLVLHGPDGKNYDNHSVFVAVEPEAKVVYDHLETMHHFRMTMIYADAPGGKTLLTWTMVFPRSRENERLRDFIAQANGQNYDRLAAHLRRP